MLEDLEDREEGADTGDGGVSGSARDSGGGASRAVILLMPAQMPIIILKSFRICSFAARFL
jgi:hypothetical protein